MQLCSKPFHCLSYKGMFRKILTVVPNNVYLDKYLGIYLVGPSFCIPNNYLSSTTQSWLTLLLRHYLTLLRYRQCTSMIGIDRQE